ncbi:MAG: UDP-N-acetylglucosamine diphosphorylase [Verrucomicrobiota bacterium]
MSDSFAPEAFFDLTQTAHRSLFTAGEPGWSALSRIKGYLEDSVKARDLSHAAEVSEQAFIGPNVILGEGVVVEPFATIKGPAIIGAGSTIRSGAYLRENVIAGEGVMMGNSCEFKNCLLFNGAEVPHFNYVGDSLLGHKAHLGAGVILSNVRLDRHNVTILAEGKRLPTELRKFGAVIGDHSEVGCNAVLSPGSLIGAHAILYPGIQWRGHLPTRHIAKLTQSHSLMERRDRSS